MIRVQVQGHGMMYSIEIGIFLIVSGCPVMGGFD